MSGEYGPKPNLIKQLAAYKRLKAVDPGETKSVEMDIKVGSLARVDELGNTVLFPGNYTLLLDVDKDGKERDRVGFELVGDKVVLDEWLQPANESYA